MINPRLNCSCLVEQKGKIIFKTRKSELVSESAISQNKLQNLLRILKYFVPKVTFTIKLEIQ